MAFLAYSQASKKDKHNFNLYRAKALC